MPDANLKTQPSKTRKLFIRHFLLKVFFEDWALKLVALLITFGLWFGVTGLSTPTTKRFTVPLAPSISNNTEITTAFQEVEIVVSGDKRKVDQINRSDLVASLDLTDTPPGDRVVSLTPDNVSVPLPQGVKLDEIVPSRIAIKLEPVREKDLEVRAQITGEPDAGFEVYGTSVVPSRIRVRGPASFVESLEFIETDSVDIAGKNEDFVARQVPVSVSNPKAAVLNTVVDVYLRIGEKRVERMFSIPMAESNRRATFTLFGPGSLLSLARADSIRVITPLSEGSEPQLILPPDLQNRVEIRNLNIK